MAVDKFPIEAGHIMLFARSIGDANPIYYDAEHAKETEAGAVIAPPTFVQASAQFDPDYFLRPKIGELAWGRSWSWRAPSCDSVSKPCSQVNRTWLIVWLRPGWPG